MLWYLQCNLKGSINTLCGYILIESTDSMIKSLMHAIIILSEQPCVQIILYDYAPMGTYSGDYSNYRVDDLPEGV